MRRSYLLFGFVLMSAIILAPSYLRAGEATDAIKSTVDEVLGILRSSNSAPGKVSAETREKLKAVVIARFDFEEMARRSLGSYWTRQSPQDQKQFVNSFTDLLMESYTDTVASYRGEKIRYVDESRDGQFAQVKTTISNPKQEFKVDYRLHQTSAGWKVYDVVIEDVSLVNNFRSQFARSLNNGSFSDLLQTMRKRAISATGAKEG
jgi:phospholipid transport system substrate-binding protein